jgi:hypothetical protein
LIRDAETVSIPSERMLKEHLRSGPRTEAIKIMIMIEKQSGMIRDAGTAVLIILLGSFPGGEGTQLARFEGFGFGVGAGDAEFFHQFIHRRTADAEFDGSGCNFAAAFSQGTGYEFAFDRLPS